MTHVHIYFPDDSADRYYSINVKDNEQTISAECGEVHFLLPEDIQSRLDIEFSSFLVEKDQAVTNILEKLLGTLVMICITSWSTNEIYACDCITYKSSLRLQCDNETIEDLYIFVRKHHKRRTLTFDTKGCTIVEQNVACEVDHQYADSVFSEYHKFNLWRTILFILCFLPILFRGLVVQSLPTSFFSVVSILLVLVMFVTTRNHLFKLYDNITKT